MKRLPTLLLACALLAGCSGPDGAELARRLGPYRQARDPEAAAPAAEAAEPDGGTQWRAAYSRLTPEQRVRYCIGQLRNERTRGACFLAVGYRSLAPKRYTDSPEGSPTDELIRLGKAAVPRLIDALADRTRTQIFPTRHDWEPWLVQDAALYVLEKIACRAFAPPAHHGKGPVAGGPSTMPAETSPDERFSRKSRRDQAAVRAAVVAWWRGNRHRNEVAWAAEALLSPDRQIAWDAKGAVYSLYALSGPECYPTLAEAYGRLPPGRDTDGRFNAATWLKKCILETINAGPTDAARPLLLRALDDAPMEVRLAAAEGLWKLNDPAGLTRMIRQVEDLLPQSPSDQDAGALYGDLVGFFRRCDTPESREAIYHCLLGRNPRLRAEAIRAVGGLGMEKAVRALPGLFDDPFVLVAGYTTSEGGVSVTVPATRTCDAAAEAFCQAVPDAPPFGGATAPEREESLHLLAAWWQANRAKLVWDAKAKVLRN